MERAGDTLNAQGPRVSAEPAMLVVAAPAKVNLFLHVTNRRADGYQDRKSVV